MKQISFDYKGFTFERISKVKARKCYNHGLTMLLSPVNLRPVNGWGLPVEVNKNYVSCENTSFDRVVNAFECYNCMNSETGKYTAFYIPVCDIDPYTGQAPTACTPSDSIIKSYDYKYMEV